MLGRATLERILSGLAPGGVYRAADVTTDAVSSYLTLSPLPLAEAGGGLLSVALSRTSPWVAVSHHPALWSPDVPRCRLPDNATAWPPHPLAQGTCNGRGTPRLDRLAGSDYPGNMLILLPPSESKAAPVAGAPVALADLTHPELSDGRRRVGDALVRVSGTRSALATLGVGVSLRPEVERNTTLWVNPAARAATVYTGVLYDAARMADWPQPMLVRAAQRVRIISALWGALAPTDVIPAYRLSMSTRMPRLGALGAFWKPRLGEALDPLAQDKVVIDCRSSAYASVWSPADAPWVTVRVLRDRDGVRTVISHMAKHTRGILAAHLTALEAPPETPEDVADAAAALVGGALVDVSLTTTRGGPHELTLVIAG